MIKVYPKFNTGNYKVSSYFSLEEIRCKCLSANCTFTLLAPSSLQSLDNLRERFKEPIIITSGYRCQYHNSKVKGKLNSRHTMGAAFDLVPANKDLTKLYELAKDCFDVVIMYESKKFIHCHNEILETRER